MITFDPNYAEGYLNRGQGYSKLGNTNRACEDFRKACELGSCEGEGDFKRATEGLKVFSEYLMAANDFDENRIEVISKIRNFIQACADVNVKTKYGATPIVIASMRGVSDIVKLLLSANADVNTVETNYGDSALCLAADSGHTEIVKLLLGTKANVNIANKRGDTALFHASIKGHTEIVKLLIEAKANVNTANKNGHTPLHAASERAYTEIVKLLLGAKADVNAVDKKGSTPLILASKQRHTEIVRLLKATEAGKKAKQTTKKAWSRKQMEAIFPAPLSGWTAGDVEITEYNDMIMQGLNDAFNFLSGLFGGDESTDEPVYYHLHRQYLKGSQKLDMFITMHDFERIAIVKAAHGDQKIKAGLEAEGISLKVEGVSPTTVEDLPAVSYTNKNIKGLSILIDEGNILNIECAGLYCGDAVERYLKRMGLRMITEFVKFPHQASTESAGAGFKSRLYVEAHPENARVKILNIHPAFYQGIPLSPSRYHVEVSDKGFITQKIWVTLKAPMDKGLVINLRPVAEFSTGKSYK